MCFVTRVKIRNIDLTNRVVFILVLIWPRKTGLKPLPDRVYPIWQRYVTFHLANSNSYQHKEGSPTRMGSVQFQHAFKVDMNEARRLEKGKPF